MFADVQSANIVGYMTKDATVEGVQVSYPSFGAMFISVGSTEKTFKLGDMRMTTIKNGVRVDGGGYTANCCLQLINPESSKLGESYLYYGDADGADDSDRGWYAKSDEDTLINDTTFPAGQSFLCNFDVTKQVELTFAGQVLTGDVTIDSVVDNVAYAYPYMANPFPVDIKLKDLKMLTVKNGETVNGGGYYAGCCIQFLDPESSKVFKETTFLYYGDADGADDSDRGWYMKGNENDIFDEIVQIKAGEGFLCNFDVTKQPKIVFSNPIK